MPDEVAPIGDKTHSKNASTAAFQQVTKLGFPALPSEGTLRDYTHWHTIKTGVQAPFID